MRIRSVLVLLALLAVAVSSPRPVPAGIIDVGGTLTYRDFPFVPFGPNLFLTGNRGFTVSAITDETDGFVGPFGCRPCLPGQPINMNLVAAGDLASHGSATLDGKTYGLGGITSPAHLGLFAGGPPLFAPPISVAPIVALKSPVNFSGSFVHVDDPSRPPITQPEVSEQLRTTATVTVEIKRREGGCGFGDCWNLVSAIYELTPTPEPATLLLFGTTRRGWGSLAGDGAVTGST